MKSFRQWLELNENVIGLSEETLNYIDTVLLEKIRELCVPLWWRMNRAILKRHTYRTLIHTAGTQPLPSVNIEVVPYNLDFISSAKGTYNFKPKRLGLEKNSLIEVYLPKLNFLPEYMGWEELDLSYNTIRQIITSIRGVKIQDVKNTIEHEIVHSFDKSIHVDTTNWKGSFSDMIDPDKYYTKTKLSKIPVELYPRIWTIARSCTSDRDKQQVLNYIKNPSGNALPPCMRSESDMIRKLLKNPELRVILLRKLWDAMQGNFSYDTK
jgi:hypothetical protein